MVGPLFFSGYWTAEALGFVVGDRAQGLRFRGQEKGCKKLPGDPEAFKRDADFNGSRTHKDGATVWTLGGPKLRYPLASKMRTLRRQESYRS